MNLLELFKLGGVFMYPLAAFFIVMIYAIVYKAIIFISFCWDIDSNAATNDQFNKKSPFNNSLHSLYKNLANSPEQFDLTITNVASEIIGYLKKHLGLLSVVATLAPITGFLGTVTGMIAAFKSITNAVNVSTQLVAGGIYEALITTATGLIISIIASIFYFFYNSIVSTYAAKMQTVVNNIVEEQYIRLCNSNNQN